MASPSYDPDPRSAWRQWVDARARWDAAEPARAAQFAAQWALPPGLIHQPRRVFMAWISARREAEQALQAARPVFPAHCRGLTCGAKTRKGTPCQRRDLYGPGARCRLHGRLSTGPKTPEGKQRAALNGHRPKRQKQSP